MSRSSVACDGLVVDINIRREFGMICMVVIVSRWGPSRSHTSRVPVFLFSQFTSVVYLGYQTGVLVYPPASVLPFVCFFLLHCWLYPSYRVTAYVSMYVANY